MAWVEGIFYSASDFELNVPRWDFPDKGISCVFGESGSGKTTLLQLMAGLLPAPIKLCVGDELISDLPLRARNVGFVFQDYALFPHMSVFENLQFAADAKGLLKEMWMAHAENLIKRLGLEDVRDQKAQTLSGGEQQRVAIARALVTKPRLVLLDEPLSALDESRREEARELIREVSAEFGVPFILVTHDLRDVRSLSENMIVLHQGKVLGSGLTKNLLNEPSDLALARAIPENQIIEVQFQENKIILGDTPVPVGKQMDHSGAGYFLVAKSWSFTVANSGDIKGEVIAWTNAGPHIICRVRLSSGQIIKAMAPLNFTLKGTVDIKIDPSTLVFFKGLIK